MGHEYTVLVDTYGTDEAIKDGWGYHNATHGIEVSRGGGRSAAVQVELGRLPAEATPLARIAGIFHDHVQTETPGYELSPRREELSVDAAHSAMRAYEKDQGYSPGGLFTPSNYDLVDEMIIATKVRGVDNGRIVQNTSREQAAGAMLADVDLGLGTPEQHISSPPASC